MGWFRKDLILHGFGLWGLGFWGFNVSGFKLFGSRIAGFRVEGLGFRDARSSLQSPLSILSDAPRFTMLALKALANFVGTGSVLQSMLAAPDVGVGLAFWIMSFYYVLMCYIHLHICFQSCKREEVLLTEALQGSRRKRLAASMQCPPHPKPQLL